jgi:hypothetical protein
LGHLLAALHELLLLLHDWQLRAVAAAALRDQLLQLQLLQLLLLVRLVLQLQQPLALLLLQAPALGAACSAGPCLLLASLACRFLSQQLQKQAGRQRKVGMWTSAGFTCQDSVCRSQRCVTRHVMWPGKHHVHICWRKLVTVADTASYIPVIAMMGYFLFFGSMLMSVMLLLSPARKVRSRSALDRLYSAQCLRHD